MPWRSNLNSNLTRIADLLISAISFFISYHVWMFLKKSFPDWPLGSNIQLDLILSIVLLSTLIVIYYSLKMQNAYSYQRFTSFLKEIKIVFLTILIVAFYIPTILFIIRVEYVPRTIIIIFLLVEFILLSLEKLLLFNIAKIIRKKGKNRKKIIIVGIDEKTIEFVKTVKQKDEWGLDILGLLAKDRKMVGKNIENVSVIGTIHEIETILHKYRVDDVVLLLSAQNFNQIQSVIETCEREGVRVRLISDFFGKIVKHIQADMVYNLPIITLSMTHEKTEQLMVKHIMDIVLSLLIIILFSPLFLFIAVLVKVNSKGPILYEWNVIGMNKRPIRSWKFRTMVCNADKMRPKLMHLNEMKGPVFKIKNDPRVTPIGRFLRKYSLDELPQFFSVLKGDMSLVGPRPAGPHELKRYDNWHRRKLSIKPGLTCLWQISGRNKISDFDEWVRLDLEYIDNWSIWLDLKILFKTIGVVLSGKGAS